MSQNSLSESDASNVIPIDKDHLSQPHRDVRQWLQDVHCATLSTLSVSDGIVGYPSCSVVPFALDEQGSPFILIAGIASHTKNLMADNRASLFIRAENSDGDPQSNWRATLVGHMERLVVASSLEVSNPEELDDTAAERFISDEEFEALKARYKERVPASDSYFQTHDFCFWRMRNIKKVRYIAGFGRICWFQGAQLQTPPHESLDRVAKNAIEHMNADHADALEAICKAHHKLTPTNIRMTRLESRGFFMQQDVEPQLLYTSFGTEIDVCDLRKVFVRLTRKARNQLGQC